MPDGPPSSELNASAHVDTFRIDSTPVASAQESLSSRSMRSPIDDPALGVHKADSGPSSVRIDWDPTASNGNWKAE